MNGTLDTAGWIGPPRVGPARIAREMIGLSARLVRHRDLILTGVARELSARFRSSLLGFLWPLITPLFLFGVYYFIFTRFLGLRLPNASADAAPGLGVYMFTGTLVWTAFAESLSRAAGTIVDHRGLIQRTAFPAEILPLHCVLVSLVTMSLGVVVFVLVAGLTPVWTMPGAALAWVPLILLLQVVMTYGLACFVAAANVFLRDTQPLLALCLCVWMFATPVFWVPSTAILPGIGEWLPWIEMNPLHHLLYAWRAVLMSSQPAVCFPHPIQASIAPLALSAGAFFIAGYGAFAAAQHRFSDEV